jgi:hypothetical protein
MRCNRRCVSITVVVVLLFLSRASNAQLAPGIDWQRVRSPHFDVVSPPQLLDKAQTVANMLEYLYPEFGPTLHTDLSRWTIKINPASAYFNGFVSQMPRYSEYYLPQLNAQFPNTFYFEDVLYELAMHETRHIAQMDKMRSGANLFWYALGGDSTLWYMDYLNGMPSWYYEGDATLFETEYSSAGRGRLPEFSLLTKARLIDGTPLTYLQAVHRSFVNCDAGDPYLQGYNMVTYMRRTYGQDVFGKILDRKNDFWGQMPFGFRLAVRRVTDQSIRSIYKESIDSMRVLYKKQVDGLDTTAAKHLFAPSEGDYVGIYSPRWINNQTVLYYKASSNQVSGVESVTLPGTRNVVAKRIAMFPQFSLHDSEMIFAQPTIHPRFENESSDIVAYNFDTRKFRRISNEKWYYTPVINCQGTAIAVVAHDSSGTSQIRILDSKSGTVQATHLLPPLHGASNPVWSIDGTMLYYIVNGPSGYAISMWSPDSGREQKILDYQKEMLTGLTLHDHWLLYTSPLSGIDNIYALDMRSKEQFQVTSRKYSASMPAVSPDGKTICFIDFTGVSGSALAIMPFDPSAWIPKDSIEKRAVRLYDTSTDTAPRYSLAQFSALEQDTFAVDRYPSVRRYINVHSWKLLADPFYFVDNESFLGLSLSSSSIFRDFDWQLAAQYEVSDKSFSTGPLITFRTGWPVVSLGGTYWRTNLFDEKSPGTQGVSGLAGLSLPLDFSFNRSRLYTVAGIDAMPSIHSDKESTFEASQKILTTTSYTGASLSLQAAPLNINGYYGVSGNISLVQNYALEKSSDRSYQLWLGVNSSLPGFYARDNFKLSVLYAITDDGVMLPGNSVLNPRGISEIEPTLQRIGTSLGYSLPLLHPDFALGPVLFVNRVGLSLFSDATIAPEDFDFIDSKNYAWSSGAELFCDGEPFSLIGIPIRIGVRYAYNQNESGKRYDSFRLLFETPFSGIALGKEKHGMERSLSNKWQRMPTRRSHL